MVFHDFAILLQRDRVKPVTSCHRFRLVIVTWVCPCDGLSRTWWSVMPQIWWFVDHKTPARFENGFGWISILGQVYNILTVIYSSHVFTCFIFRGQELTLALFLYSGTATVVLILSSHKLVRINYNQLRQELSHWHETATWQQHVRNMFKVSTNTEVIWLTWLTFMLCFIRSLWALNDVEWRQIETFNSEHACNGAQR